MRIGASFILIEGYCYQSYQWKYMRPLGKLSHVLNFLDKYEVDEVCITRPIRKNDNPSTLINDFQQVKSSLSNSPISIGGGLRSIKHIKDLWSLFGVIHVFYILAIVLSPTPNLESYLYMIIILFTHKLI